MNHQGDHPMPPIISPMKETNASLPKEDIAAQRRRLQIIKKGLLYRKLKPKTINYDEEDLQHPPQHMTPCVTKQDKVAVVSLADFSAKSINTLETAELGEYSKAEVISKSLAYDAKAHAAITSSEEICTLCNQEYDAHQIVSFTYNSDCKHVFHAKCMIRWLMKGHEHCPICNKLYLKCTE